jgi:hypothetical protein
LSKYRIYNPKSKILFILDLIKVTPVILHKILLSLALSLFSLRDAGVRTLRSSENIEYLFISHFTHAQNPNTDDIFFGHNLDYRKSFTFFLNHTRLSVRHILRKYHAVSKTKVVVNAKTLLPLSMIKLHFNQIQITWWLLKRALQDESLEISKKRVLIKASVFQHERSTIANLVMKRRLSEVIVNVKPRYLVFTLEGHAHENQIIELRANAFKELKLIAYQHAPMVPGQLNLYRIVAKLDSGDFFLTSGETTKQNASHQGFKCRVEVLGSLKAREYQFQVKDSSRIQVLVAPEGTKESLIQFIRLINDLVPKLPEVRFVLRIHPALGRFSNVIMKKDLKPHQRVTISASMLEEDLRMSHLVLFRSSAIGIECLSFGVLPIHFNDEDGDSLNPILDCGFETLRLNSSHKISDYLAHFDPIQYQNEAFQKQCYAFFNGYFGKLRNLDSIVH